MPKLRKFLRPLSYLYDAVTTLRNKLFDRGILSSQSYPIPVIAVGNLSAGGTGKTPMTEYLVRLLQNRYKVAVLSRGYGRKTSGYRLAGDKDDATTIGDEPYQFYCNFPDASIAVDGNRRRGITNLRRSVNPGVIILDDAFQHRYVTAGLYILLTAYGDLFTDDTLLPSGNLRERTDGMKRAQIIVVTKCPVSIGKEEMERIRIKIDPEPHQKLFFSHIEYDDFAISKHGKIAVDEIRPMNKTLVAGIAKPGFFFDHLKNPGDAILEFADHHDFGQVDIDKIQSGPKPIITTEKDFMRLKGKLPSKQLYYLPIRQSFTGGGDRFDSKIIAFCKSYENPPTPCASIQRNHSL